MAGWLAGCLLGWLGVWLAASPASPASLGRLELPIGSDLEVVESC